MPRPGLAPLPPGIVRIPGLYRDVCPRWSHDGKQIAFLRRTTDRAVQLCIASADLRRVRPILAPELVSPDRSYDTGLAGYDTPESIEWSPDDLQVAFSRPEGFTFEDGERLAATGIWACDIATGKTVPVAVHARKYTRGFYFLLAPRWSPNGRYVACVGEGIHGETALHVRALAGVSPTGIVPRYDQYEDVGWPAWSPDGRRLAFRQGILHKLTANHVETLRVVSPGGLAARNLVVIRGEAASGSPGHSLPKTSAAPRIVGISWSPDGRFIAYSAIPDGTALAQSTLAVIDVGGTERAHPEGSTESASVRGCFAPVWIGTNALGALRADPGGGYDVVVLTLDGHGHLPASPPPASVVCHVPTDDLDWSPDRRRIVFAMPDGSGRGSMTTLRILRTGL